ncbi:MAG: transglutaminase-like domain-containing protein [Armatimonadetes bacterium]|nr:transglutaminase-like domain-containing protein [Armatimonadota bacterium]MDW8123004.1 transglutaminase-like domain-containing protein [Armatimonadota bacterium]
MMMGLFFWSYLTAIALMWIVLWLTGLALDLPTWGLLAAAIVTVVLIGNFLITHSPRPIAQTVGRALWLTGLFWFLWAVSGGSFQPRPGAVAESNLIMIIGLTAVIISFLVGRRWGPFYGALSFLTVPSLSLFGLIVPVHYGVETVIGFILGFTLGLFLASLESLLIRWEKGQLVQTTPRLLLRYCWYLSIGGAAATITIALILVPPATLLRAPIAERLFQIAQLSPFARYLRQQGVDFPESFSIAGGPINLPDVILFRIKGTQYERWRVRAYAHYIGAGWRVSNPLESAPASVQVRLGKTILQPWEPPSGEKVVATVRGVGSVLTQLPVPGELVRLEIPGDQSQHLTLTQAGTVLVSSSFLNASSYIVDACPIPETLQDDQGKVRLDSYSRRILTEFPFTLWRVRNLARAITAPERDLFSKVKALEAFLQSNYQYTDSPPVLPEERTDAVSFFLFEARRGACDWFASALALMCRAIGVPARVITGFYATEPDPDDPEGIVIKASDAHAWVEAFIDGYGWVTLDATPGSLGSVRSSWFNRWVNWLSRQSRNYLTSPYSIWWTVGALWFLTVLPLVGKFVLQTAQQFVPRPSWTKVVRAYVKAARYGASIGMDIDLSRTPYENAAVCQQFPRFPVEGKEAFRRLADLVVQSLYAARDPEKKELRQAQKDLKTFLSAVRTYRRWFQPRRLTLDWLYHWWQRL